MSVLTEVNIALLAKLVWCLIYYPTCLSSLVLETKYGGWQCLGANGSKPGCSIIWRSMQKAMEAFYQGLGWSVRDGSIVKFWTNSWLKSRPLREMTLHLVPPGHLHRFVKCTGCRIVDGS